MAPPSSFQAFVDASAGAAGALCATICLFPLDIAKTRKQAHVKVQVGSKEDSEESDMIHVTRNTSPTEHVQNPLEQGLVTICRHIVAEDGLGGLFVGLSAKALHTVLSNFTYFYWYSFLKATYQRKVGTLSTSGNLMVASIAGALNMSMTLPLEVVVTRQQTHSTKQSTWNIIQEVYRLDGWAGFWRGYLASLVLTSNPAINYTLFDQLKLQLQVYRMKHRSAKRLSSLTMWEAFILGAFAKAIATIVTYPYIRAKVVMQSQGKQTRDANHVGSTLCEVLQMIGKYDGISGYYKGCNAQLFNTVLKSALLLMTKEQITKYTMRVLYAIRKQQLKQGT